MNCCALGHPKFDRASFNLKAFFRESAKVFASTTELGVTKSIGTRAVSGNVIAVSIDKTFAGPAQSNKDPFRSEDPSEA